VPHDFGINIRNCVNIGLASFTPVTAKIGGSIITDTDTTGIGCRGVEWILLA